MEEKEFYKQLAIKRYTHWTLKVHENQNYLGKAVIWLEREGDMQRLSSLTQEERAELWDIVFPEYEAAAQKLFQPDHMNYSWLGNMFELHHGHGHMHMVPRYASSREFAGRVFEDKRWGKHYSGGEKVDVPLEIALMVRDAFKSELGVE